MFSSLGFMAMLEVFRLGTAQQCLSCLTPNDECSTTVCASGVTAVDDKLYIGGLFASTPGDLDGGLENLEHFKLAVAMINDHTDGCV